MRPRIFQADPRVHENGGRIAVEYGPFVYCAEEADNGKNLRDIQITSDISVEFDDLWQVNILRAKAYRSDPDRYPSLYREMPADDDALPFTCRLIPYFCFANREEGEMLVWLGYRR